MVSTISISYRLTYLIPFKQFNIVDNEDSIFTTLY